MAEKSDRPKHPYVAFEQTRLWGAVERAVSDLEGNQDLKLTELREYVVGYICKVIARRSLATDEALSRKSRRRAGR